MKTQRGAISGMLIGLLTVIGIVAVIAFSFISYFNYGNRVEQQIEAKYKDNENVYAQGTQKVMEVAQVPSMYRDDLEKIVKAAIQGRYGPNGSQATFQWLQEQNPALDAGMYVKIQQVIESFRNEFKQSQTSLLDMCRSYKTTLGAFPGNLFMSMAGYPKINLQEKCEIVTTDQARQTFETKRDGGIQLRPQN